MAGVGFYIYIPVRERCPFRMSHDLLSHPVRREEQCSIKLKWAYDFLKCKLCEHNHANETSFSKTYKPDMIKCSLWWAFSANISIKEDEPKSHSQCIAGNKTVLTVLLQSIMWCSADAKIVLPSLQMDLGRVLLHFHFMSNWAEVSSFTECYRSITRSPEHIRMHDSTLQLHSSCRRHKASYTHTHT